MPKGPRSKRVVDPATGRHVVIGRAPNGAPEPYFDKTRGVWVAPWRKPNGKVGRPTGKTKAAAVASRDRHVERARIEAADNPAGFTHRTTIGQLSTWWLDHVARHRVRPTTLNTYRKQLRAVGEELGRIPVGELRAEQVASFMSSVTTQGTANHANNLRTALNQVMKEAVNLGLVVDNVVTKVRPHRVPKVQRATLSPEQTGDLLDACEERFVAAVALCYVQGWRVSEALGLAWQDLDLEAGTARVRRGSTYADGVGMVLGPTKNAGARARQLLAPTVIDHLRRRQELQADDRELVADAWPVITYEGEQIDPVFTTPLGTLMLRQHVDRAIRKAAEKVGLDRSQLGTHTGRRSVVTNLYATGTFDLGDVSNFVGHADVSTTRGYVQHQGDRPAQVSVRAFELLDPKRKGADDHQGD